MDSVACNTSRTSVPSPIFIYLVPMRILQEKKVNVKHGYKIMKLSFMYYCNNSISNYLKNP